MPKPSSAAPAAASGVASLTMSERHGSPMEIDPLIILPEAPLLGVPHGNGCFNAYLVTHTNQFVQRDLRARRWRLPLVIIGHCLPPVPRRKPGSSLTVVPLGPGFRRGTKY